MKTITEFTAIFVKNASKTKSELLAAGKTAEELPAAMTEALKVEGDRLNHLLNVLEAVGEQFDDLKRAVAFLPAENEKTPESLKKVGEHCYLIEYYPAISKKVAKGQHDHKDDRGRGKGRGKGGKAGGRGRKDGDRSAARPPRRDQRTQGTGKPPVITPKGSVAPKSTDEVKDQA